MFGAVQPNKPAGTLTQRNIWWAMTITDLVINDEKFRDAIPNGATIIVLPDDDQELRDFNLKLAQKNKDRGTIVFIEVKTGSKTLDVQRVHTDPVQSFAYA